MNDYRDYIAHYGVKGMKWHEHRMAHEYEPTGRRTRRDIPDWLKDAADQLEKTATEAQTFEKPVNEFLANPSGETLENAVVAYGQLSPEAREMVKWYVNSEITQMKNDWRANWKKYVADGVKLTARTMAREAAQGTAEGFKYFWDLANTRTTTSRTGSAKTNNSTRQLVNNRGRVHK